MLAETWGSTTIHRWPELPRVAAQKVLDRYGEPAEVTQSSLVWYRVGEWKRVVASREYYYHLFPDPHTDSIACVIDYDLPLSAVGEVAAFDGSVIVDITAGELTSRCRDIEANRLALNLVHDIAMGRKDAESARAYCELEIRNSRRAAPTPYREQLLFGGRREEF